MNWFRRSREEDVRSRADDVDRRVLRWRLALAKRRHDQNLARMQSVLDDFYATDALIKGETK